MEQSSADEESRRRAAEESFRVLLERTTDAIAIHRQGRIVYANPAALRLLGYPTVADVVGKSPFDFVSPAFRALVADRVFESYSHHALGLEVEERFLHADGTEVPVEVISIPLVFEGEAATLVHIRDIRARKELAVRLRAADRLASVGLIAASVAHEVNNPLTYALFNAETLAQRFADLPPSEPTDEMRSMLGAVREGIERAVRAARDVRVFSGASRNVTGRVDVHRVLDSCANVVRGELHGRARLVKRYGSIPMVMGDEARLGQVFLNLVLNAVQAIARGAEESNEVTLVTSTRGAEVVVEVKDTGPGIAPALRKLIFEPLFTTKPQGSGLGLAISRVLVEEQGGTLSCESEVGKGSTFSVVLRAAPVAVVPSGKPQGARSSGKRILIVDDEPRLASVLQSVLAAHQTAVATNGRQVLERLRAGERYDVILCDLSMPDIGGVELFARIRQEWPELEDRVVFMSGGGPWPSGAEPAGTTKNRCLEKPFEPSELLDVVDAMA